MTSYLPPRATGTEKDLFPNGAYLSFKSEMGDKKFLSRITYPGGIPIHLNTVKSHYLDFVYLE